MISEVIGYEFDDSDWLGIADAMPATDDERPDGRYSYPLVGGRHQLEVHLAQAVGGDEVSVRLCGTTDEQLGKSIDLLLSVFARYRVK